jgi:hypothetical protein
MKIPEGMNESEVVESIQKVARNLAPSFVFGYLSSEDIEQEAVIFGIEALEKFDSTKSALETFLYTCVRNRLISYKRDNFHRSSPPCKCEICRNAETEAEGMNCPRFAAWMERNRAKKVIMEPLSMSRKVGPGKEHPTSKTVVIQNDNGYDISEVVARRELLRIIDEHLPISYRIDYCRMLEGLSVAKPKREKLLEIIKDIIREHYHGEETWETE